MTDGFHSVRVGRMLMAFGLWGENGYPVIIEVLARLWRLSEPGGGCDLAAH
jgi:hypothetical protein